jgi:hypothetical protein
MYSKVKGPNKIDRDGTRLARTQAGRTIVRLREAAAIIDARFIAGDGDADAQRRRSRVGQHRRLRSRRASLAAEKVHGGWNEFHHRAYSAQANRLRTTGRVVGNRNCAGQIVQSTRHEGDTDDLLILCFILSSSELRRDIGS